MNNKAMDSLLKERHQSIMKTFQESRGWESKYRNIIQWGKKLPLFPDSLRQSKWLIQGCQAQVWLYPQCKEDRLVLQGDSDALITKGLLSLVIHFYNNIPLKLVIENKPQFIEELSLIQHLTPIRAQGLSSLINQIQKYAQAFHIVNQNN